MKLRSYLLLYELNCHRRIGGENTSYHISKHHGAQPIDIHVLQQAVGVLDGRQVAWHRVNGCLKRRNKTVSSLEGDKAVYFLKTKH